jgi:hypothetical protein
MEGDQVIALTRPSYALSLRQALTGSRPPAA